MELALLDTDILSEVLRQKNENVKQVSAAYLRQFGQFAFSGVTRFEIIRGFREKKADRQLAKFSEFCSHSLIVPVTDAIFDRAAELWAVGRQAGYPCGDADVLIAATALDTGRALATGNTSHFEWIPQLRVVDWRTCVVD